MKHFIASLTITIAILAKITLSTPVLAAGVNDNPWNYNFTETQGSLIYKVPSGFCGYFHCIPTFASGRGYVVECHDGFYSKSGGISGSCSRHKGNWQTLYAHEKSVVSSNPAQPVTSGSLKLAPSLPLTGSDPYEVVYAH